MPDVGILFYFSTFTGLELFNISNEMNIQFINISNDQLHKSFVASAFICKLPMKFCPHFWNKKHNNNDYFSKKTHCFQAVLIENVNNIR